MFRRNIRFDLFATSLLLAALATIRSGAAGGANTADKPDAQQTARAHWENVVQFYGDEETGEWSLRIADKDVKDRGWFEFLELWHFNRNENRWEQLKTGKIGKAIVLPKQKTSDEPQDSQTLIELKEIEPKTAGVWFAKWKVDDVEGSTPMRVGTAHTSNKLDAPIPDGMIRMAIPINLDKSEAMIVPDPRIYCVAGGPGKPQPSDAKK
jgi:hypothetical protein